MAFLLLKAAYGADDQGSHRQIQALPGLVPAQGRVQFGQGNAVGHQQQAGGGEEGMGLLFGYPPPEQAGDDQSERHCGQSSLEESSRQRPLRENLVPLLCPRRVGQREAADGRNFVKKAVNWALRQIGKRSPALRAAAIESARQIRAIDSPAARWIAADALKELENQEPRIES